MSATFNPFSHPHHSLGSEAPGTWARRADPGAAAAGGACSATQALRQLQRGAKGRPGARRQGPGPIPNPGWTGKRRRQVLTCPPRLGRWD